MGFANAFWSALQGEVSEKELRAYRGSGLQTQELNAALKDAGARDPLAAWQLPDAVRYALLFHWVADALLIVANHLLDADAEAHPPTRGFLPRLTFDQAKALYVQVPDHLRRGFEALANPLYAPDCALPIDLSPRLPGTESCPDPHLRGLMCGVEALEAHADLRLTTLKRDLGEAADTAGGDAARETLARLEQAHAAAAARMRWGRTQGDAALAEGSPQVRTNAVGSLWDALADLFLLGQMLAMPDLLPETGNQQPRPKRRGRHKGRQISRRGGDRWSVSDPAARRELEHSRFGESEINAFWQARQWRVSDREADTMAEIAWLRERQQVEPVGPWAIRPFGTVYRAVEPVYVLGHRVPRGHDFYYDLTVAGGRIVIGLPSFGSADAYLYNTEEGRALHLP